MQLVNIAQFLMSFATISGLPKKKQKKNSICIRLSLSLDISETFVETPEIMKKY